MGDGPQTRFAQTCGPLKPPSPLRCSVRSNGEGARATAKAKAKAKADSLDTAAWRIPRRQKDGPRMRPVLCPDSWSYQRRGTIAAAATVVADETGAPRFGATHSRNTNHASDTAPTLNSVSAGTRIHTSRPTIGCCMNSAERANQ